MAKRSPTLFISHWHQPIEGLQASPKEFYASVEEAIRRRNLPDTKFFRIHPCVDRFVQNESEDKVVDKT